MLECEDGYQKPGANSQELLNGLRERDLQHAPKLAGGDGSPGFTTIRDNGMKIQEQKKHCK